MKYYSSVTVNTGIPDRTRRVFMLALLMCSCAWTSRAQSPSSGILPFTTQEAHQYDTVNLGNLNISINIPVRGKVGAIPFSYALHANSNLTRVVSSGAGWASSLVCPNPTVTHCALAGGLNIPLWGRIGFTSTSVLCPGSGQTNTFDYRNWYFADGSGGQHLFTAEADSAGCIITTYPVIRTAIDGSGYTLVLTGGTGSVTWKVYDVAGNVQDISSPSTMATDPNGNKITNISGVLTDSLGFTALTYNNQIGTNPDIYIYNDEAGQPQSYQVTQVAGTWQTAFGCPLTSDTSATPIVHPTTITIPDATQMSIGYELTGSTHGTNVTGRISSLTLPTGGQITYAYSGGTNGINCSDGTPATLTRTTPDGVWSYVHTPPTGTNITSTTTVHDPSGNTTTYTFLNFNAFETQRTTSLETVITCYNGFSITNPAACVNPPPANGAFTQPSQRNVFTTIGGVTTQSADFYDAYGQQTEHDDYGFAPAYTLIRKLVTVYALNGSGACSNIGAFIHNHPCSVTVSDGNGVVAQTLNTYDSLGNLLTQRRLISGTTYVTESFTYDPTGSLKTKQDAKGTVTTYVNNACNGHLPTSVTTAGVTSSEVWDCNGGVVTSTTDPNGQLTSYDFSDPLWRQTRVSFPNNGQISAVYNLTAAPPNIQMSQTVDSAGHSKMTQINLDSQGRPVQVSLTSDPDGVTYNVTAYDSMGRISKVYNPTRCVTPTTNCGESTWGMATFNYDVLNRVISTSSADGGLSTYAYANNCVTITDPASKASKQCFDAIGRVAQVFEDPLGLNYETDLTYNVFGKVTTINQKGGSTASTNWRTRTFLYDGLARLTSATNTESGTVSYVYDANGNLQSKTSPAPNQTGSSTITVTYCYDALNRLTAKGYGAAAQTCTAGSLPSPIVTYSYDQGPSGSNAIGRRTGMTDPAGSAAWTYDPVGLPTVYTRINNGVSKSTVYTYNPDGSIASITYPSERTVSYAFSGAARPVAAVDQDNGFNYILAGSYSPAGALNSVLLGQTDTFAGIHWTQAYNARLQAVSTSGSSPAGVALNMTYCFNTVSGGTCSPTPSTNNGNLTQLVNNRDTTRSQSFTYDAINRLITAQTAANHSNAGPAGCWAETYTYDAWGNLLSVGPNSSTQSAYIGCSQESGFDFTGATASNNRLTPLSGYGYDAPGNLTSGPVAGITYSYDAENHLTQVTNGGMTTTYLYDGLGRRMQKSSGKLYWYGMDGNVLDESDAAGNITDEYVFFGGKRIARQHVTGALACQPPTLATYFYFGDQVGNSRIVTDVAGNVVDESDFYPYGGERTLVASSGNNYKFTSAERDSESGLDHALARNYSSMTGRWMSADPYGGDHTNPQSLNRYTYVLNNPLSLSDPLGLWHCDWGNGEVDDAEANGGASMQQCSDQGGAAWVSDAGDLEGISTGGLKYCLSNCFANVENVSISTLTGSNNARSPASTPLKDDTDVEVGNDIWNCAGCHAIWNGSYNVVKIGTGVAAGLGGTVVVAPTAVAVTASATGAYLAWAGPSTGFVIGTYLSQESNYVEAAEQEGLGAFQLWSPVYRFFSATGNAWTANAAYIRQQVAMGREAFVWGPQGARITSVLWDELELLEELGVGASKLNEIH
jgi:RHS repeat-associated protein